MYIEIPAVLHRGVGQRRVLGLADHHLPVVLYGRVQGETTVGDVARIGNGLLTALDHHIVHEPGYGGRGSRTRSLAVDSHRFAEF